MLVQIDVNRLIELKLTADQYVWLKLMFEGQTNTATKFSDMLKEDTDINKYLLSKSPVVINRSAVAKLFNLNTDYFWEFFSEYPLKVPADGGGYRSLKTQRIDTKLAKDMKKKYESRVKTLEAHNHVMRCLKADMEQRKRSGSLKYMPAIEAYINGQNWEKAEHLLETINIQSSNSKEKYGEELL
jgi:hypothetical protein